MWALICSFSEGLNSEEEVLILHKKYESRKIVVSFWGYESFNLDNFDNSEVRAEFKVDDEDTPLSLDALHVRGIFQKATGTFSSNKCNHAEPNSSQFLKHRNVACIAECNKLY